MGSCILSQFHIHTENSMTTNRFHRGPGIETCKLVDRVYSEPNDCPMRTISTSIRV